MHDLYSTRYGCDLGINKIKSKVEYREKNWAGQRNRNLEIYLIENNMPY